MSKHVVGDIRINHFESDRMIFLEMKKAYQTQRLVCMQVESVWEGASLSGGPCGHRW